MSVGQMSIAAEMSFSPAPDLEKMEKGARIYSILTNKQSEFEFTGAIAFEYEPNQIAIALQGDLWVKWALAYDQRAKASPATAADTNPPAETERSNLVSLR